MKRINPRMFELANERDVLRHLARVKALFQQMTLENLLTAQPSVSPQGEPSPSLPPRNVNVTHKDERKSE